MWRCERKCEAIREITHVDGILYRGVKSTLQNRHNNWNVLFSVDQARIISEIDRHKSRPAQLPIFQVVFHSGSNRLTTRIQFDRNVYDDNNGNVIGTVYPDHCFISIVRRSNTSPVQIETAFLANQPSWVWRPAIIFRKAKDMVEAKLFEDLQDRPLGVLEERAFGHQQNGSIIDRMYRLLDEVVYKDLEIFIGPYLEEIEEV